MDEKVLTNEEVDKIIALLNEDKTLDEIRNELGLSRRNLGSLIPHERRKEYMRALDRARQRKSYKRRKAKKSESNLEGPAAVETRERYVEHKAVNKAVNDVLQDVAKRPSPKSEIVRSGPRKAEEKTDWWKYASIALGIVVLGGVFLFALTRGSKPREDQTRESKPRDKRNREPKRVRYKALADKYKVI